MRFTRWLLVAGTFVIFLPLPIHAQEEGEKRQPKGRPIRLLAIGDEPVFRADLEDGVLREREIAEGMLPPREVTARTGKETEVSTELRLGGFSPKLEIPKALTKLRLRDSREAESESWTDVALPAGNEPLLILLWRDPEIGKWSRARHVVLPDSLDRAPVQSLRVVNVTGAVVALKFAGQEQAVALKPGRSVVRRIAAGGALPVSVAVQQRGGEWLRLFQGEVEPGRTNRSIMVVYRSDGEAPRRPANFKLLTERVVPIRRPEG